MADALGVHESTVSRAVKGKSCRRLLSFASLNGFFGEGKGRR
ncbi:hypothetical protein PO124_11320 [Bacillus licheniformis]|nr:hypothetical protein [Bacillus licheniformis]